MRQPVAGQPRECLEVGTGQVAETDGQDVELALLDEREQESEGPLEGLEVDLGGRLRASLEGEADRGRGRRRRRRRHDRHQRPRHQLASSARRSASPATGSAGLGLVTDEVGRARAAAGGEGELGRAVGVVAQDVEGAAEAGQSSEGALDRWPVVLPERPGHAMPDADGRALGGIVQEPGQEELRIGTMAGRAERRDDVEAVALVGRMHGLEEPQLGGRQPVGHGGPLVGRDAAGQVPDELAGLARPPAAHYDENPVSRPKMKRATPPSTSEIGPPPGSRKPSAMRPMRSIGP